MLEVSSLKQPRQVDDDSTFTPCFRIDLDHVISAVIISVILFANRQDSVDILDILLRAKHPQKCKRYLLNHQHIPSELAGVVSSHGDRDPEDH